MKRIYFIVNLHSGKAMIASKLAEIIDMFTKARLEVTIRPTQEKMDAAAAAKYACSQDFDMIVCSGGDGTLNEVIHGVMNSEKQLPIGYIPAGSTNDFARGIGIPKDMLEAAKGIVCGKPVKCDIGSFNDKFFTYIAAFGAFTDVTYETSQNVKNYIGHAAYLLNALTRIKDIKSYHMKITTDTEVIEDDFMFGMVTNSSSVAGILSLDDFKFDDGVYEVVLIRTPKNPLELKRVISSLLNIEIDIDTAYIKSFRTSEIHFECAEEIKWTVDGEFGGKTDGADIRNNKKAITFITDIK